MSAQLYRLLMQIDLLAMEKENVSHCQLFRMLITYSRRVNANSVNFPRTRSLLGEVGDSTPSGCSSGLGHVVMATELCTEASEVKAEWGVGDGWQILRPWEEKGGKEGDKVVGIKLSGKP